MNAMYNISIWKYIWKSSTILLTYNRIKLIKIGIIYLYAMKTGVNNGTGNLFLGDFIKEGAYKLCWKLEKCWGLNEYGIGFQPQ